MISTIITFLIADSELQPNSDAIKSYTANFVKFCGPLNLTYSFQNASLNGGGFCTLTLVSFICMVYYNKLTSFRSKSMNSIMIQENGKGGFKGMAAKILLVLLLAGVSLIPILTLNLENTGSAIIILFTNVIIPLAFAGYFLIGGPYDYLVQNLFKIMNI